MQRIYRVTLVVVMLGLSGCATLNDAERAVLGGGAGFILAGPLGASPTVGTIVGAGAGLLADDIFGF